MGARDLYIGGPDTSYVKSVLYDLLRIISKIELFYKLRGLGAGPRRHLSRRLGYSGRTTAYKDTRRRLINEGVLDKRGVFIENDPNLWLAHFSDHVENGKTALWVGRKIPYMVFLALALNRHGVFKSPYDISSQLRLDPRGVYRAVEILASRELIDRKGFLLSQGTSARQLQRWLLSYIDLAVQHANVAHNSSILFTTVPAYIDGLEAVQRVRYVPGMPIGPAPMVIRTYAPYMPFWIRVLREVGDFKERSESVSLDNPPRRIDLVWIAGLPYASRPQIDSAHRRT
jgi:hypothetical protein